MNRTCNIAIASSKLLKTRAGWTILRSRFRRKEAELDQDGRIFHRKTSFSALCTILSHPRLVQVRSYRPKIRFSFFKLASLLETIPSSPDDACGVLKMSRTKITNSYYLEICGFMAADPRVSAACNISKRSLLVI